MGEILYFNAILAPKGSRARWRATQVWKQNDRDLVELVSIHSSLSTQSVTRRCNAHIMGITAANGDLASLDDDLLDGMEENDEVSGRVHPSILGVESYLKSNESKIF